ncbi:hypothetical protein ACSSS7_007779 [Eimeria intestinalis]
MEVERSDGLLCANIPEVYPTPCGACGCKGGEGMPAAAAAAAAIESSSRSSSCQWPQQTLKLGIPQQW